MRALVSSAIMALASLAVQADFMHYGNFHYMEGTAVFTNVMDKVGFAQYTPGFDIELTVTEPEGCRLDRFVIVDRGKSSVFSLDTADVRYSSEAGVNPFRLLYDVNIADKLAGMSAPECTPCLSWLSYKITYWYNVPYDGTIQRDNSSYIYTNEVTVLTKPERWNREGYEFLGWALAADAEVADFSPGETLENAGSRFAATTDGEVNLYAVWQKIVIPTATMTIGANHPRWGTVLPAYGDHIVELDSGGVEKQLSAEPGDGYRFVDWSDGSSIQSRTVVITTNCAYWARFEPIEKHVLPEVIKEEIIRLDSASTSFTTNSIVVNTKATQYLHFKWRTKGEGTSGSLNYHSRDLSSTTASNSFNNEATNVTDSALWRLATWPLHDVDYENLVLDNSDAEYKIDIQWLFSNSSGASDAALFIKNIEISTNPEPSFNPEPEEPKDYEDRDDSEKELAYYSFEPEFLFDSTMKTGVVALAGCEVTTNATGIESGIYTAELSRMADCEWLDGFVGTNRTAAWRIWEPFGESRSFEPCLDELPVGALSYYDTVRTEDGSPCALDTEHLLADMAPYCVAPIAIEYSETSEGPWTAECPSLVSAGSKVVWYRIVTRDYGYFIHCARLMVVAAPPSEPPVEPDPDPDMPASVLHPTADVGEFDMDTAYVYNGWLMDGEEYYGTIQVKTATSKNGLPANVMIMVTPLATGKRTIYRTTVTPGGNPMDEFGIIYGHLGLLGSFNGYAVAASLDFSKSTTASDKDRVLAMPIGTWSVVVPDGDGLTSITFKVVKGGRVNVFGRRPNLSSFSFSTQGVLGENDVFAFPVQYSRRNFTIGFVATIESDSLAVNECGSLGEPVAVGKSAALTDGEYTLAYVFDFDRSYIEAIGDIDPLPTAFTISNGKIIKEKTVGLVRLDRATGEPYVSVKANQVPANLSSLRLNHNTSTGAVTGSFRLYYLSNGRLRYDAVWVSGVSCDGRLYLNAIVRRLGVFIIEAEQ